MSKKKKKKCKIKTSKQRFVSHIVIILRFIALPCFPPYSPILLVTPAFSKSSLKTCKNEWTEMDRPIDR